MIKNFNINFNSDFCIDKKRVNRSQFPDYYICSICDKILPFDSFEICSKCTAAFCSKCLSHTINELKCPNCKKEYEKGIPMTAFIKGLKRLEVKCKYENCQHISEFQNLKEHEEMCDSAFKNCQNCKESIRIEDLKEHEENCEERKFNCPNCPYEMKASETSHDCSIFLHIQKSKNC